VREKQLGNVRLQHGDALEVLTRVPDEALSFLYLLHPDPWPKARHAKRRMMNDGPVDLFAAKLKPGGEFRFGTDHPVYLRHALMVMRRHTDQFEWLVESPQSWQNRPGGWPETRYEAKARRLGHEVWYFRFRRR
jgi:tRNA (guanine-N7-)-methyltransferase